MTALPVRTELDLRTRPVPSSIPANSRHPGDIVRIGLGLTIIAVALLGVQRDRLSQFEIDVFRLINDLPDGLSWFLGPAMQLGNIVAAPLTAVLVAILLRSRFRVTFDVAAAGVAAWFAAKAVKTVVERPRPGGLIEDFLRGASTDGLGFVSGHTAVATAIVAAASPYLPRTARRLAWLAPLSVGVARIYYGAHLPLDVVGGAALGWAIAATIHLAIGAPHRVPTADDARRVLRSAGVAVTDIAGLHTTARGSFPFVADIGGTRRFVKLLDPEPRDRDWLFRAARFLAFRDVRDEAAVTDTTTQAHREAAMTLLARCGGVNVPTVQAIESDRGRVWIVEEHVDGTPFDQLSPDSVTDDTLANVWRELNALRHSHIAHRDLVGSNVLVTGDGTVWIVDFAHAKSTITDRELDNDVAELLVTTALVVGASRAVGVACDVLGADAVVAAVPELQPLVLTAENRAFLRRERDFLTDLRTQVRVTTGSTEPQAVVAPSPLGRRVAVTAVVAAVTGALLWVVTPGEVVDVLSTPGYRWLGFAALCIALSPIAAAVTFLASIDRRLALGRAAGAILSFQARSVLDGPVAGHLSLVRGLGRSGVHADEAEAALTRWRRLGGVAHLVAAAALAVPVVAAGRPLGRSADVGTLIAVAAAAFVAQLGLAGRRRSRAPAHRVLARPRTNRPVALVASLVEVVLGAMPIIAVTMALGGGAAVASVSLVAVAAALAGRVGPTPGVAIGTPAFVAAGLAVVGATMPVAVTAALVHAVFLWLSVTLGSVVARVGDRR